ncbi:MAG: DNA cytosine methyltransferase [Phycisphaerae bacterium]|nr:DNA cytosine methyltransferase [Phycisphaerae bacterium]
MSGTVAERKRLIRVTAGNLRNSHIYITGHYDFFPNDCIGSSRRSGGNGKPISIQLEGLNRTVRTDIASDGATGKPRRLLRGRSWVREFFEHHRIHTGDVLALERIGERGYRLYPFHATGRRDYDWGNVLKRELEGAGPTVLELFAGCGGLALGFKKAGFRTVLAIEWDPAACASLRANVTERLAQCAVEEIEAFPGADVVAGGPPCQGFSNLGEKVPYDPRRQLWRQFLRALEQSNPWAFVMENVPPLLKSQEYAEIRSAAEKLGFQVDQWVLNVADYGVPQTRKRAIVIGLRGGAPSIPPPSHVDPRKRGLHTEGLEDWMTVRDAIGDLPFDPTGRAWHIGRNPTPVSLKRYACIPPGGNRWNLPSELMPECWKRKVKGGTDLFGRLWWDRPSVTIRTEFYKPEKGRYLHPEANRPITHREAARLQGFDDQFIFCGTKIQVGRQIGNAVPPPLGTAIARHVSSLLHRVWASSGRRKATAQ